MRNDHRPEILKVGPDARLRCATERDAAGISALYRRAYSCEASGAEDNYPFPQVLDRDFVRRAIARAEIRWIVAEADGRGPDVCGCVGAALHTGPRQSRVSEFFGLVVDRDARRLGLGSRLLGRLCEGVGSDIDFAIGEMRTADPGVAHAVRKTPLRPMGFEPFVHQMFGSAESMIVVGAISSGALRDRSSNGGTTARVRGLAEQVLEQWGLQPLPLAESARRNGASNGQRVRLVSLRWLEARTSMGPRPRRWLYESKWRGRTTGVARVVEDPHDRRLRLTSLAPERAGGEETTLCALLETLGRDAGRDRCLVVADAWANDAGTQRVLEAVGFRPVAYFPALLPERGRRCDAVRFAWFSGVRLEGCLDAIGSLGWSDARRIACSVAVGFAG